MPIKIIILKEACYINFIYCTNTFIFVIYSSQNSLCNKMAVYIFPVTEYNICKWKKPSWVIYHKWHVLYVSSSHM